MKQEITQGILDGALIGTQAIQETARLRRRLARLKQAADRLAAAAEKAVADLMLEYVSICDPKATPELPGSVAEFRAALHVYEATKEAE